MTKVKVSEVIRRCQTRVDRYDADLSYYVAGEHFESGEIDLAGRGEIAGSTIGPMFYYGFKPGDFLLVSRNPHLKKASRVDFAGICSEKTFVLESADENALSSEYLPWILQNDKFWDYAQRNRHGSTNFFINWSTLADYEFELPPIEDQKRIADILWAAQSVRRNYRKLLATCDDVVKSQFVEMFVGKEYPTSRFSALASSMRNGLSPSKSGSYHSKVLTLSAITQGRFDSSAWKDGFFSEEPPAEKRVSCEDFYVCRGNGNKHLVGAGEYPSFPLKDMVFPDTMIAVRIEQERIILPYLRCAWSQPATRKQIEASAKTTNGTFKINQTALGNIELLVPPLELQREFADFAASVDKSKFAVQRALDELNATTKKIMNQELGLGDV